MFRSSVSIDVRLRISPLSVPNGTCSKNAAAIGSMSSAGIWLPGKKLLHAPVDGLIVLQIGANPEKSPPRASADGTEKVFVNDRSVRWPS